MKKLIIAGVLVILGLGVALVYLQGQYSKTAESMPTTPAGGNLAGGTEKIKLISNGESVDLQKYLVKDHIMIFDFYADWCGPCKILAPKIEELVNKDDTILLRQVNIVDWNSEVAKQYEIQFVPNIRVYNKQGQMVGEPTPDYNAVVKYIKEAKNN
jgi:thiol-disulfide isomerase/thioredoxin